MKNLLLIATSNPGKYREIMEVMGEGARNVVGDAQGCLGDGQGRRVGDFFEIVSSGELGLRNDVVEDGETYEENAEKKARYYLEEWRRLKSQRQRSVVLAEDSGIVVDALEGELGVKTRRWGAGETATDEQWIDHFLYAMSGVPEGERGARFICCAAVLEEESGELRLFRGVTEGVITRGLEAPIYHGLPISSCFRPVGFDKVYAALSVAEKNMVSHRGKAMHEVRNYLLV